MFNFINITTMKKALLSIIFLLTALAGWSQDIMGKWVTEAGDAQVEIYQQGDKVNGKIVATLHKGKEKDHAEFVDANGSLIGYAVEVKTGYNYFDKYGNPAGTVEFQDRSELDAIYKDRFGNVIGYSQRDGCFRRNFLDAKHNIIGAEIGSNALPLRPVPVEIWLKMRK